MRREYIKTAMLLAATTGCGIGVGAHLIEGEWAMAALWLVIALMWWFSVLMELRIVHDKGAVSVLRKLSGVER